MKVAIVTPTLSHFEVPMFRVAAALSGIELCVFHCDASPNSRYDADYKGVIDWGESLRAGYPSSYFASYHDLGESLWAWQPNVILQYGYASKGALSLLFGARARRVPVVHRGLLSPYRDPRTPTLSKAWRMVRPFVLRLFDAHHFGGAYHQRVLSEAGISPQRCYFVPYSVDTPHFSTLADDSSQIAEARQIRQQLGWSATSPILLFIAQHSWVKGPDIMLDIAAIGQRTMPHLKLIMAGNGVMSEQLKSQAALKLRPGSWHFPGFVSSKKTVPWYLASDLAVFPSHYDTWSRAVNEAMLCRTACQVSHFVGAAGGLVDEGKTGMVVQGLEPGRHAERLLSYFGASSEFRRRMGDEARNRALEFSYENHSEDLRRSFIETATIRS